MLLPFWSLPKPFHSAGFRTVSFPCELSKPEQMTPVNLPTATLQARRCDTRSLVLFDKDIACLLVPCLQLQFVRNVIPVTHHLGIFISDGGDVQGAPSPEVEAPYLFTRHAPGAKTALGLKALFLFTRIAPASSRRSCSHAFAVGSSLCPRFRT